MIEAGETVCPLCGGALQYYDRVGRIVRRRGGEIDRIPVRRFRCVRCHTIHREIPAEIIPHKQYEAQIVEGVLDGSITSDMLGYEDYPCEITMLRWLRQKPQN